MTKVWCAVVKDHDNGNTILLGPDNISDLPACLDRFETLIGHNCIAFDFPVLKKVMNYEYKGQVIDTLLMSRLQRPNRKVPKLCASRAPHSVESWGYKLGVRKTQHEEWDRYSPEMLQRCRQDVEIQHQVYSELLREGEGEGWGQAHRINHKLFTLLQQQAQYGFLLDRIKMDEAIATLDRWMVKIDKAITPHLPYVCEIGEIKKGGEYNYVKKLTTKAGVYTKQVEKWLDGYEAPFPSLGSLGFSRICYRLVDLDKNLEVKNFLLKQGWSPDDWNHNDAGEKTSPKLSLDDKFNGIQSSLGRLVVKRLQCRQRRGVIQGWKDIVRSDGRIPGTVGGLAATGRARHKHIVNVPRPSSFFGKAMRSLFIAKPGWVLVGIDSVGNQIRQFAARMNDPSFTASVLDPDADIHMENARNAGLESRAVAKNFYYAMIFGSGDAKTGKIIGGSAADGKRLKERFFAGLPKMRACIDKLQADWRRTAKRKWNTKFHRMEYYDGYITGLDGRRIQVPSEHMVLVYTLQSDEAIQMSVAYCRMEQQLRREGWFHGQDFGVVLWMHDEFQIECRPEIAERVGKIGCDAITWAAEHLSIPILHEGSYNVGNNWSETH